MDLRFAIFAGNLEEIKKIIKQAREQYGNKWTEFNLVMRETVIQDKLEILKYLHEEGDDNVKFQKELIRLARKFNRQEILEWLLNSVKKI